MATSRLVASVDLRFVWKTVEDEQDQKWEAKNFQVWGMPYVMKDGKVKGMGSKSAKDTSNEGIAEKVTYMRERNYALHIYPTSKNKVNEEKCSCAKIVCGIRMFRGT